MSKNLIRKIISSILFIIIIFFIYRILISTDFNFEDKKMMINVGGFIFAVFFLFLLTFTFQTEMVYKEKNIYSDEEEEIQTETINESKTGERIKKLTEDLRYTKFPENFADDVLKAFAKEFYFVQGMLYVKENDKYKLKAAYAGYPGKKPEEFMEGEGITGQAVKNKKISIITDIPEGYINVVSGLGAGSPSELILIPFVKDNETVAVLEAAAFEKFPEDIVQYHSEINKLSEKLKS